MASPINRTSSQPLNPVYFEEGYLLMIETHLSWLESQSDSLVVTIEVGRANTFKNDLTSYLNSERPTIPRELHYPIMRLNGWTSPSDFTGEKGIMRVCTLRAVEELTTRYLTSRGNISKK